MTRMSGTRVSALMTSSARPSPKNSLSRSPDRMANGRTATTGVGPAPSSGAAGATRSGAVPSQRSSSERRP